MPEEQRKFVRVQPGIWRCGPLEIRDRTAMRFRSGWDDSDGAKANLWVGSAPWVRNISNISVADLKQWAVDNYDKIIAEYGEDGRK